MVCSNFDLDDLTMKGAWRLLCISVLYQCVQRLAAADVLMQQYKAGNSVVREQQLQVAAARDWLLGGRGVVTFEDACECIQLDPDSVRAKVQAYVTAEKKRRQEAG